jgi:hypothetical protein
LTAESYTCSDSETFGRSPARGSQPIEVQLHVFTVVLAEPAIRILDDYPIRRVPLGRRICENGGVLDRVKPEDVDIVGPVALSAASDVAAKLRSRIAPPSQSDRGTVADLTQIDVLGCLYLSPKRPAR